MPPRLVHRTISVPLRADGTARFVAVADTHSAPHGRIAEHVAALAPDAIFHAGDIGELSVLEDLGTLAPLYAVRGNIDTRAGDLPDVLTIELAGGGRGMKVLMTHIAVYGPKIRAEVAKLAREAGATLIVCGHSHVPFIGRDKGLTVFNPGSIGPRRLTLPIVFGIIDVTASGVRLAHVNCETGGAWSPP